MGLARGAVTYSGVTLSPIGAPSGFGSVSVSSNADYAAAGGTVGYGQTASTYKPDHALLWPGAGLGPIDLNPIGSANNVSKSIGTNGSQQVGAFANDPTGKGQFTTPNAMLWNGTAASAVNLNPTDLTGITQSTANGTDGAHQVGWGYSTTTASNHAMLWNGTAASAVDLHPSGFYASQAYGVGGGQQVGYGNLVNNGLPTALLWSGSAASAVNLQPTNLTGFSYSGAYGVANGQQVGFVYQLQSGDPLVRQDTSHAVLWTGTAGSAVDLNPTTLSGINQTLATATNGSRQVGVGYANATGTTAQFTVPHALMWTGTAGSAVNLEALLPSNGSWTTSRATSVDAAGDVFGTASGTANGTAGTFAVEWLPTTIAGTVVPSGQSYSLPTDAAVESVAGLTVGAGGAASFPQAPSPASRRLAVVAGNGLSLAGSAGAWTGKLDLANNDLDLPGASLATVTSQLAEGFANGYWNGSGGITSSTAAADADHVSAVGVIQNATSTGSPIYASFDGQSVTSSDVLARYTLYGDTNLDGVVNAADYARIDAGYTGHLSGWANGDFNYDGVVDGTDYALMDNAYDHQQAAAGLPAEVFVHPVADVSAVPEPAGMVAIAMIAGLVGRRRRA